MDNYDHLDELETLIRAGFIDHRRQALDELAQMPSGAVTPLLIKLSYSANFQTYSANFQIRRIAVMGVGHHPTSQAFQACMEVGARQQVANVVAEAANSLFEFGEQSISLLQDLFMQQPL